jgi:hypothetical protein
MVLPTMDTLDDFINEVIFIGGINLPDIQQFIKLFGALS